MLSILPGRLAGSVCCHGLGRHSSGLVRVHQVLLSGVILLLQPRTGVMDVLLLYGFDLKEL